MVERHVHKRILLPDDVRSALDTARLALASSGLSRSGRGRYVAFYLVIFAIGALAGSYLQSRGSLTAANGDFWRTALTVLAILTGFMITTMLFTGKAESSKSLSLEQLVAFSEKSNHLLLSELATLGLHVIGIVAVLAITAIGRDAGLAWLANLLVVITSGLLLLSLFRSALIPLHIIELHRFAHAALLAEKRAEIAKEVSNFDKM